MERLLLVGTVDGVCVAGADLPLMLAGHSVDHLATTGQDVWALTDRRTVWRAPGGESELHIAAVEDVAANCLLPDGGRMLLGTSDARLFELAGDDPQPLESFDAAPGRAEWYTPWGGPPDVRSMARGVDGRIYVNIHVGGVLVSQDGGRTWAPTLDIDADVHEVIADPLRPGHAYAAAAIGLGITTDGGASWQFTTAGLHASYCRAVAVSESSVFVSASTGPSGRRAALYHRPLDSDDPLQPCREGLPEWFTANLDTFCLASSGHTVVAADVAGTVFASTDDGGSWSIVATGLPAVTCVAFA